MRPQTAPTYAPDGTSSTLVLSDRTGTARSHDFVETEASAHEDGYDDGLVHRHEWAISSDTPSSMALPGVNEPPQFQDLSETEEPAHADDYDDGLVHRHEWAMATAGK